MIHLEFQSVPQTDARSHSAPSFPGDSPSAGDSHGFPAMTSRSGDTIGGNNADRRSPVRREPHAPVLVIQPDDGLCFGEHEAAAVRRARSAARREARRVAAFDGPLIAPVHCSNPAPAARAIAHWAATVAEVNSATQARCTTQAIVEIINAQMSRQTRIAPLHPHDRTAYALRLRDGIRANLLLRKTELDDVAAQFRKRAMREGLGGLACVSVSVPSLFGVVHGSAHAYDQHSPGNLPRINSGALELVGGLVGTAGGCTGAYIFLGRAYRSAIESKMTGSDARRIHAVIRALAPAAV